MRELLSGWLADQLEASNEGVLRLPCDANGVDPGGDPPGEALARVAFGGQASVTRLYDLRHRSSERPSLPSCSVSAGCSVVNEV